MFKPQTQIRESIFEKAEDNGIFEKDRHQSEESRLHTPALGIGEERSLK